MSEQMPDPKKAPFQKDLAFHEKKWDERAAGHLFKNPAKLMRDEAERDNAYYDKRLHEEYQKSEEMSKPVRVAFLEQANQRQSGEKSDIVTVAIFPSGGMRAAGAAGPALALNSMGIQPDYIVGASSGLMVGTALAGGKEHLMRGIAMMRGPLADKAFIDVFRHGNTINLAHLKHILDDGEYAVDEEAIKRSPSKLWGIVTEPVTDKHKEVVSEIIDMKTLPEGITSGIVSSMSIPGLTGEIPTANGEIRYDGGFGAFPLEAVIAKVKAENPGKKINVLVFMQETFEPVAEIRPSSAERVAATVMREAAGPLLRSLGSQRTSDTINQLSRGLVLKEKQREFLEAVRRATGADVGMNYTVANDLSMTSTNAGEIESTDRDAFWRTFELFGVKPPVQEMPEYVPAREQLKAALANFNRAA